MADCCKLGEFVAITTRGQPGFSPSRYSGTLVRNDAEVVAIVMKSGHEIKFHPSAIERMKSARSGSAAVGLNGFVVEECAAEPDADGLYPAVLAQRLADKGRNIPEPKPYDPVAVLEAMPGRGWSGAVTFSTRSREWSAIFYPAGYSIQSKSVDSFGHPDFLSAVRWLHRQAAAADPEFAREWPVPS